LVQESQEITGILILRRIPKCRRASNGRKVRSCRRGTIKSLVPVFVFTESEIERQKPYYIFLGNSLSLLTENVRFVGKKHLPFGSRKPKNNIEIVRIVLANHISACPGAYKVLNKMERGFLIGFVIILALTSFCHSLSDFDENDESLADRKPLLEKLGMEMYRDPHWSPYGKKRCYCGYGYKGKGPMNPWGGGFPPFGPFRPFPRVRYGPRRRPSRRKGSQTSDDEEE
ncbi:unnamed protein product, partial [Porites evermanni]